MGKRTWLHAMLIADGMEFRQVRLQYCEVPYAVLGRLFKFLYYIFIIPSGLLTYSRYRSCSYST